MDGTFDPYYAWLGIPPEEQPPNHYRLLGLRLFEENTDVIRNAADRQYRRLLAFQLGKHAQFSCRLLNEVAAATSCLLSPEKKRAYDQQLRAQAGQKWDAGPGHVIVLEVETGRPYHLNLVSLLRFRVTNILPTGCAVTLRVKLHGQGRFVEQNDEEVEQSCQLGGRGDQRIFAFSFRGLAPGAIPIDEFRAVVTRDDKPGEATIVELPDQSLFVQVSDPGTAAAAPGIVIRGGIDLDFSQLKEMYGSDIRNVLAMHLPGEADRGQVEVQFQAIQLRVVSQKAIGPAYTDRHGIEPGWGTAEDLTSTESMAPEESLPTSDNVHFSAYAPSPIRPDSQFSLSIWAFLESQRGEMERRAERGGQFREAGSRGPVPLKRGARLVVCVVLPGFDVEPVDDLIHWSGEIANAVFTVTAPARIRHGTHIGCARVFLDGYEVCQLRFEVVVAATEGAEHSLRARERPIRSVFASYASEDRAEVLQWARGARLAGIDVFLDVISLREGQNWRRELEKHIPKHDLFCLFWSKAASRSKWVQFEWERALDMRGCDYIHPVALVDPKRVPPPKRLSECLHFEDVMRIVLDYGRMTQRLRKTLRLLGIVSVAVIVAAVLLVIAVSLIR